MRYRYERTIGGQVCYIDIEYIGLMVYNPVIVTDSTFKHLIGLQYKDTWEFERHYPDYKVSLSNSNQVGVMTLMNEYLNAIPTGVTIEPKGCLHTFVPYVGMIETFEYCTKCDAKKGK